MFSQRSNHILHRLHQVPSIKNRLIKLRCINAPRSYSHIKNKVILTILTFQHIQCLHLINAEEAWVLVYSGTQVQPHVILDPDYLLMTKFLYFYRTWLFKTHGFSSDCQNFSLKNQSEKPLQTNVYVKNMYHPLLVPYISEKSFSYISSGRHASFLIP